MSTLEQTKERIARLKENLASKKIQEIPEEPTAEDCWDGDDSQLG